MLRGRSRPSRAGADPADAAGASEDGDRSAAAAPRAAPRAGGLDQGRFRLRDLDRWGRVLAALLALGLLAAPVRAAVVEVGRWSPQGDDALIELRARDTGTERTPLVGQPSTSGLYATSGANVAHPGPAGLYVLVPGIRALGSTRGVLAATVSVVATSALVAAWVVFRQVGPRGGAVGAVGVALALWTAGGAGMLDPLSSNFGRFPLVAAAVLVWALACGDVRLAPLAAAVWSFAAQQHLSVLPAAAVVGGAGALALVAAAVGAARRPPGGLKSLAPVLGWTAAAVGVALVAWSPVLTEEITHEPGNLTALSRYSGDEARVDLGWGNAVGQVVHVVAVPPFLGRSGVAGWDLVDPPGAVRRALAIAIGAALVTAGWWARRRQPRLTALVALVVVVAVAGVVTGANIPDSTEKGRLNFYHWAFALSLLELLAVAWIIALVGRWVLDRSHREATGRAWATRLTRPVGVASVVAVVALALAPVGLDRRSDRLLQPVDRAVVTDVVDRILAAPEVGEGQGPLLTLVVGDDAFVQLGDTIRVRLIAAGIDATFPPSSVGFVHPDRRPDPCSAERALVIGLSLDTTPEVPGRELVDVAAVPGFDQAAFDRLVIQATGATTELGPDLEAALEQLPGDQGGLIGAAIALRLGDRPAAVLRTRSNIELLLDHPPTAPALDRRDLTAVLDSFPDGTAAIPATRIRAHLLDRAELRAHRPDLTADCP